MAAFLVSAIVLPPLPIALGNSGPHICLLATLAGVFTGLRSRWRIPDAPVARALLLLFVVLLASTSMAMILSGPAIAGGSVLRVFLFGISVLLFFQASAGRTDAFRLLRGIFAAAVVSGLFACIDYYFQFPAPAGFAPQFVWLSSGVFRRAQGVFYEASTLGNFCAFFLVMILVALARGKRAIPVPGPVLAIAGLIFSAALVLSYSRASVLNIAVSACALAYLRRGILPWRRVLPVAILSLAATALVLLTFFPALTEAYQERAASIVNLFSSPEGTLSGRIGNWETLIGFLREHPQYALLGIGYKTIPYSGLFGGDMVADNVYLGILVETGIAGLCAVLWLNATILRTAYLAATADEPRRAFFGTWIFCFWAGESVQMLSGDLLTYWRVLPLYFWVLAIATRHADETPDRGPVQ
jgi:O-antigen ligase